MAYALGSSLLLLLLGLVTRRLLVYNFGTQISTASQVVSQLFNFFSIAEFGVGSVISYRLYEQIAAKNVEKISKYMSMYKWAYRAVGLAIAVLALLGGESGLGWGLIVLYLVITVARNFLEPRIVGSSIGLPPLLSLVCVYAGLRLFGVLGAVLMPCAALTVLFFLKSNRASPPAEKPE